MKRALSILASVWIAIGSSTGQTGKNEPLTFPPVIDSAREGQAVAARLRAAMPGEDAEYGGVLRIRRGQVIRTIPITSRLSTGKTSWQIIYETQATDERPAQKLTVIHASDQPNVYHYRHGTNEDLRLTGHETAIPFAGSDFWLMDLGVEFLHWPEQRLLKREMRKQRACQVLESRPTRTSANGGYARVVSWIDAEADGVLMAEAYDVQGKLLKEFEIDKFTKVEGRWQLKRMEMRSYKPSSRTVIEFDFDGRQPAALPSGDQTDRFSAR